MRSRRWWLSGAAAVALVALGLSGCSGEPADPIASDEPTETPREPAFASPEEAFEAAVATYQRYVDLLNLVGAEGGKDPERLREVFTDSELASKEVALYEGLHADGRRAEGSLAFHNPKLMQYQDAGSLIQMYVCFDVSNAKVIDRDGNDVTPAQEPLTPLLITFAITPNDTVLIDKSAQWQGAGVC